MAKWLLLLMCCVFGTAHAHIADGMKNTPTPRTLIYQPNRPEFFMNHDPIAPNISTHGRFKDSYLNRQIALWSLRQINQSMSVIDDAWVNEYLWQMTAKMNATVRSEALVALPIINDGDINAFAVTGGLIGLNTGTILASGQIDEVASVLAHEIAHLSQRHYEHSQDEKGKMMALQLGGLLAAILASSVSGDLATTAFIGTQTAMAESMATHSREHEKEADRVGMMILSQSGFDARAMPRFFEKLNRQTALHQSKDIFIPSFIKSHPMTAERLSESTDRAKTYPVVSMMTQERHAKDFDKLTWRLRYLMHQTDVSTLATFAKDSVGARLSLVSMLADDGRYEEAMRVFEQGRLDKSDPLVCITHAHVMTKQGDHQKAVSILSSCQMIYPERRDLRLHLAQAWVNVGEVASALPLLKPLTDRTPHDKQAWQLTQRAYEKSPANSPSDTIHALHARSQVELWNGQYQGALQSNAQAMKLAKDNSKLNLLPMLERSKEMMIQARDYRP